MRLTISTILLLGAWALGDTIYLTDGRTLHGDVKRDGETYIVTGEDGTTTTVSLAQVKRLELSGGQTDPGGAAGRLASLRRSVANQEDLEQIIVRYEQFIAQPSNAAAVPAAQEDLATWRQRRDQGLVKYAGQWVSVEQRDHLRQRAGDLARQALGQLQAGDAAAAAGESIAQALRIEPDHPLALYLRAHLLIGQEKFADARKVLEQLLQVLPGHAPTLNNLAVVFWRQNQIPAALLRYEQAMAAMPFTQAILDNVAEALHAVPAALAGNAVVRKTTQRFTEQDARLQGAMAAQGWYRWGGSWIDKARFEELQKQQQAVEQRMARMQQQYDDMQATVDRLGADIDANERSMRQIVANSYFRDSEGRLIQMPLPGVYYQLLRDNERLALQRQQEQHKQQVLRTQAQSVKDQLPQPTFSGVQRPIGLSGAPQPAPASQPVPTSGPVGP